MDRHRHLALKKRSNTIMANVRMDCVGKEVMKNYFWLLNNTGFLESVEWNGGMEWWNGMLE